MQQGFNAKMRDEHISKILGRRKQIAALIADHVIPSFLSENIIIFRIRCSGSESTYVEIKSLRNCTLRLSYHSNPNPLWEDEGNFEWLYPEKEDIPCIITWITNPG